MFEKYIMIKDTKIEAKQTSSGIWYCSNLPADDVKTLDVLIGEVNQVLNKYNKQDKTSPASPKGKVRM
jgi:hypothetical protein